MEKVRKIYVLAKTLNLHNTHIPFRESSFCARLLSLCDVINNFFPVMHYAKLDLFVLILIITFIMTLINVAVLLQTHFQSRMFWKLHQLESQNFCKSYTS